MPYEIKKVARGYYVINKDTKKKYSKKPITKENAQAQLRILEAIKK